ncbi:MAG: hypothetical protein KAJ48_09180 [Elusimicrobiales bacterium]|nr:hypothetical protein [Elusimicrobiales bacterium]
MLTELINQPSSDVFRRAYIKRKLATTGLYESEWQSISPYVIKWGSIRSGVDDVRLNRFVQSGINMVVNNNDGKFNDENNRNSLWHNYLTRYGTLLKIEAGYKTHENVGWGFPWGFGWGLSHEYPTDSCQGIFVMDQEMPITTDNKINLNCSSLQSVFDGVKANEIVGLGPTNTASGFITLIKNHWVGGKYIFRQYISDTSWNIQSTSNYYNLGTTTTLDNEGSVWDFMVKLSESEGYVLYIDRFGHFHFSDRTPNTTASQFSFYGQGFPKQNIIKFNSYREAFNRVYSGIRLKHLQADTNTSYVSAGTTTVISPDNVQWKYGADVYKFENTFIQNTTTAQTIANNLFNKHSVVKNELNMIAKFNPALMPLDYIDVNYHSYDLVGKTLWDGFNWDEDSWANESENFDWDAKNFKILSKNFNIDNFSENYRMREV